MGKARSKFIINVNITKSRIKHFINKTNKIRDKLFMKVTT